MNENPISTTPAPTVKTGSSIWGALSSLLNNGSSIFNAFQKNKQIQLEIDRLKQEDSNNENKARYQLLIEQLETQASSLKVAEISKYAFYVIALLLVFFLAIRRRNPKNASI